jgi:hypothetical protein
LEARLKGSLVDMLGRVAEGGVEGFLEWLEDGAQEAVGRIKTARSKVRRSRTNRRPSDTNERH